MSRHDFKGSICKKLQKVLESEEKKVEKQQRPMIWSLDEGIPSPREGCSEVKKAKVLQGDFRSRK